MRALFAVAFLMSATAVAQEPETAKPVRLIFDTDMMGDVDDVGTAAVLHALADQGKVEILAMGLSGKNPWSPLCLDALNNYYRRPDIPIGVVKGPAFDKRSRYAVRGLGGGLADYWDLKTQGYLRVNEDGSNEWRTSPDKDHAYLVRKMDPKKIAEIVEELMLRPPSSRR